MNLYKHKTGLSVDLIAIANEKVDDRPTLAVYKVLLSGEVFTLDIDQFNKEFDHVDNFGLCQELEKFCE